MRLSHEETTFWYGCALRVAGMPAGALDAAIAMIQWAEIRHRLGVAYFDRRWPTLQVSAGAMKLSGNACIDGGGQSSLIAGPAMLDIATVAAKSSGCAVVTAHNVSDLGWLGQLTEIAARRGFAAVLGFAAGGSDAEDLAALYAPEHTIAALPDGTAIEWRSATGVCGLTAPAGGVVLRCTDPARHPGAPAEILNMARAQDAAVYSRADIKRRYDDIMRNGIPVDAAAWRRLAGNAFSVLAESTERSLHSAGA